MNASNYDFENFPSGFTFEESEKTLQELMVPQLEDYHPIGRQKIIDMTFGITARYFMDFLIIQSTTELVKGGYLEIDIEIIQSVAGPSSQIMILQLAYPEVYTFMRTRAFETLFENQDVYDLELKRFILQFYPKIGQKIVDSYKESEEGIIDQGILAIEKMLDKR